MKRRHFLAGGAAALGLGWWLRPEDQGQGGHDAYFSGLQAQLKKHGLARPTLLLDLDRLDHNIEQMQAWMTPDMAYRVVAKSLPSPQLLDYVMQRSGSRRLMAFHQPFLNQFAASHPDSDLLLGKPMPVEAAARFYRQHRGAFDPARQLQWLIDSEARLQQYQQLAQGQQVRMRINVEIDVGLHRGGLQKPSELHRILQRIDQDPLLEFSGLMGYDPHVTKAPAVLGLQQREFAKATARYRSFLDAWRAHTGEENREPLCLNAAGSPTFRLWKPVTDLANELAVGSGLVKPTDFDMPTLDTHQPAVFIGTPVIKQLSGVSIPIVPALGQLQSAWNPNRAQSFFIYGGYWKAQPVSPAGLSLNPTYGRSSNQEMLNGSARVALQVDDTVFYRPTQSEFVMLQFGDIAVLRSGQIVDQWPVLSGADRPPDPAASALNAETASA